MKILMDTCVWGGNRNAFSSAGYDVVWASDWQKDPGDNEILARAYKEKRVLIILDKDFGELAIVHQGFPNLYPIAIEDDKIRNQPSITKKERKKKFSKDYMNEVIVWYSNPKKFY